LAHRTGPHNVEDRMPLRAREWSILGGALALVVVSWTAIGGVPSAWSPGPAAVVSPLLLVGELLLSAGAPRPFEFAGFLAVPVAFVAWTMPLRRRDDIAPRSRWAALVLGILALAFLPYGAPYGLDYQGAAFVAAMVAENLLFAAALGAVAVRNRRRPAFKTSLAFHLVLFGWLAWCAFPWMGELI
jgi:hypothetical protein